MAATCLANHPKFQVHLFEKRKGLGRKLLIAGSSGLNISHQLDAKTFAAHYQGFDHSFWLSLFENFGVKDWLSFIEKELKLETFLGTSDRYFVREMKAASLLKNWTEYLERKGVMIHSNHELNQINVLPSKVELSFESESSPQVFDQVALFLGGGSWESETPRWPEVLRKIGIEVLPFQASNVGYEVAWSAKFLAEAEGQPLKKIVFRSQKGTKAGELMVTRYGLEGTPIYFFGTKGPAEIDLLPDFTEAQILERLKQVKENMLPLRRAKQKLPLSEAALALLFHHSSKDEIESVEKLAKRLKTFPVKLMGPRPLEEAISSQGGAALSALDSSLQFKKAPRIYAGGEMLAWDAPTGGFLIQASVSQGAWVARKIAESVSQATLTQSE